MPSIDENRRLWGTTYNWAGRGEEWSEVWGGSEAQWTGSILPRIRALLPVRRALEIGCGHGRWSRLLRHHCRELVLIDLAGGASKPAASCSGPIGRSRAG